MVLLLASGEIPFSQEKLDQFTRILSRPSQVQVSFRTGELFEKICSANGTDRTVQFRSVNYPNNFYSSFDNGTSGYKKGFVLFWEWHFRLEKRLCFVLGMAL